METSCTVVISTHLIAEVENLIDHTIILREGRILRDAPTEELVSGACTISGPAGLVEAYLAGREILTSHALGGLKSVTFQGALTDPLPVGLEQGRVSLQDYFISLQEAEDQSRTGVYLSALTAQQKCQLWRTFLEKGLPQPEFEWLRNALLQGDIPNWIEWHLALYRVLEEENIRFFCKDGQFELLDKEGHRIYFGVDHSEAAEQVLMKVLFPLNQMTERF